MTIAALLAFGVISGVLAGLLGVGGGVFMVPFLVLAIGATQQEAQATSLVVILPTAIAATVVLWRRRTMDGPRALQIGAIGAVSAVAGSLLALALPGGTLRIVFAAFLAAIGLRLIVQGLRDGTTAS
jgi:hypothetical protein